jgi:hypothetical protein
MVVWTDAAAAVAAGAAAAWPQQHMQMPPPPPPPPPSAADLIADLQERLSQQGEISALLRNQPGAGSSGRGGDRGNPAAPGPAARHRTHRQLQQQLEPQQQPGGSVDFSLCGGFSDSVLADAAAHMKAFQQTATELVEGARCCAWCGRCALGGRHSMLSANMRARPCAEGDPPVFLSNPLVIALTVAPSDGSTNMWWACQSCYPETPAAQKRRQEQEDKLQPPVVEWTVEDELEAAIAEWKQKLGLLLSLPAGAGLQLAVLQCGVQFAQRVKGYLHCLETKEAPSLLSGPLVNWDIQVSALACLLAHLLGLH